MQLLKTTSFQDFIVHRTFDRISTKLTTLTDACEEIYIPFSPFWLLLLFLNETNCYIFIALRPIMDWEEFTVVWRSIFQPDDQDPKSLDFHIDDYSSIL